MIKSRLHGIGWLITDWHRLDGYKYAYAHFFGVGRRRVLRSELEPVSPIDFFSNN